MNIFGISLLLFSCYMSLLLIPYFSDKTHPVVLALFLTGYVLWVFAAVSPTEEKKKDDNPN